MEVRRREVEHLARLQGHNLLCAQAATMSQQLRKLRRGSDQKSWSAEEERTGATLGGGACPCRTAVLCRKGVTMLAPSASA